MSGGEGLRIVPDLIEDQQQSAELIEASTLGNYTLYRNPDGSSTPTFSGAGEEARRANELAQAGMLKVTDPNNR